ncbi:MAG: glycosyltransferase family 4 protein [Pleurocapsa sp. MO_226.B13]|nr:glycosyltransferase family 4 protein [Pleurocapsa sp. MO_226.B13]
MTPSQLNRSSLRFIVLQMGARMHYAVPVLLARANMLEHLYTDICGNIGITKILDRTLPIGLRPKAIKRLLGRQLPPEVSSSAVTCVPITAILESILKLLPQTTRSILPSVDTESKLRRQIIKDRFLNGNAIYSFINSDLELIRQAKAAGLAVVHEQIISPSVGRILREERALFPGIESQVSQAEVEKGILRDRQQWEMSDLILSASQFVTEEIINLGGDPQRIASVPYGIDRTWFDHQPQPIPGRILFVGSVGLRKGNHYLAAATRILQGRLTNFQVRVVGPYNPEVINRPEFQGPDYIGQVPRSEVIKEFLSADIFVLPTLSESFGLVHLEAMSCGLPVITTPNCGSVVRDGIDGFIVPIRDAEALAERIERLLSDRSLRQQMSRNARQRAEEFTWEKYGDRILSAIQTLKSNY